MLLFQLQLDLEFLHRLLPGLHQRFDNRYICVPNTTTLTIPASDLSGFKHLSHVPVTRFDSGFSLNTINPPI